MDGATSKASWGKLFLCAQTGQDLPADCYLDSEGRMTLDPQAVLKGGCLLPFAGHKGYGIAVAIELLTGMLAGAALGLDIPHPYKQPDKPGRNAFFMAAIRVDHFTDAAAFKRRMDEWIRLIRDTRKAPGVERIWLPGEIELVKRQERLSQGIPLGAKMMEELESLANEARVPFARE